MGVRGVPHGAQHGAARPGDHASRLPPTVTLPGRMPCQLRASATPGRAAPGPAAARPAQRPLPGPRCGGPGAACVLGACLAHRTTSFAVCSSDSGGAMWASLRRYSSRRCLYLSSRCCSASVISRLAIRSPAPGRSRPAGSSTKKQTRIPRSRCTSRRTANPPCRPPQNGGIPPPAPLGDPLWYRRRAGRPPRSSSRWRRSAWTSHRRLLRRFGTAALAGREGYRVRARVALSMRSPRSSTLASR